VYRGARAAFDLRRDRLRRYVHSLRAAGARRRTMGRREPGGSLRGPAPSRSSGVSAARSMPIPISTRSSLMASSSRARTRRPRSPSSHSPRPPPPTSPSSAPGPCTKGERSHPA
jgi:hypothetical protein